MENLVKKSEIYDLKYHISDYIVPRLTAYKEKFEKGESPSSIVFYDDKGCEIALSDEESDKQWIKILNEMLFPFENYNDSSKYEHLDRDIIRSKSKKGLELFAKYFDKLWI